jgi:hypothetical protein
MASAFQHQGQSGTDGHRLVRHCLAMHSSCIKQHWWIIWTCRVYPFPPPVWMCGLCLILPPEVWIAGCIRFHCQQYGCAWCIPVHSLQCGRVGCYVSLFTLCFFKCRNAGLSDIWSVQYQNEQECRCHNQSGTGIRGPSTLLECSGTEWDIGCRQHRSWCWCPAMLYCNETE